MLKTVLRAADLVGLLLIMAGLVLRLSTRLEFAKYAVWPIYVGLALVVIGLAAKYREIIQWVRRRNTALSVNSFVSVLIVLATLGAVNYIGKNHEKRYDMTKSRINSLSDQTVKVVKSIDKKLEIKAFYPEVGYRSVRDLLTLYRTLNTNIDFQLIDPDRQPEVAKAYNVTNYGVKSNFRTRTQFATGTLLLIYGDRQEKVENSQGELQEELVTSALVRVLKPTNKTIYFLTGHGEKRIDNQEQNGYAQAKSTLENERFTVKPLNLVQEKKVPDDCSTLVISGPTSEPFNDELTAIGDYLNRGGGVMLLLDPSPGAGLVDFLKKWRVDVGDNVIIDMRSRQLGASPAIPIITKYGQHKIVEKFDVMTFYPFARSVAPISDQNSEIRVETLMETGPDSWAEVDYKNPQVQFNEGRDKRGPISLGVAVTKDLGPAPAPDKPESAPRSARLVVIGDSDFAANGNFQQAGNGNLFMNCASWLAQDESFISIRAKNPEDRRTFFTETQGAMLRIFAMFLLPLSILAVGIAVWTRRRA